MRKQDKIPLLAGTTVIGLALLSAIAFHTTAHLFPQQRQAAAQRLQSSFQPYPRRGPRGGFGPRWRNGTPYSQTYDLGVIKTIRGTVMSSDFWSPMRERQLLVNSENKTVSVHLGPPWYLNQQDFQVSSGDDVIITGSMTDLDGKPTIIAGEIQKGSKTLTLRDHNGIPAWRNWPQQGGPGRPCCW